MEAEKEVINLDSESDQEEKADESEESVAEEYQDYDADETGDESEESSVYDGPSEDSEDEIREDTRIQRKEKLADELVKKLTKKTRNEPKKKRFPDIVDSDAELAEPTGDSSGNATTNKKTPIVIDLDSESEASDNEDQSVDCGDELLEESNNFTDVSISNIIKCPDDKRPKRKRTQSEYVENPETGIRQRSKEYKKRATGAKPKRSPTTDMDEELEMLSSEDSGLE